MVFLCFVLDLRSLSPPLLRDLSQSLLQLANYYAVSLSSSSCRPSSDSLLDRIGLGYISKDRISFSDEGKLKIAYTPTGKFNLRDFHRAICNLPSDACAPEFKDSGAVCCGDINLASILNDKALYSWGGKDIVRKLVVLGSWFPKDVDSVMQKTLQDAANKCVSVQFVFFEKISSHLSNIQENINNFAKSISDLENCSFRTYLPDATALHGLVKQWLQDLKDDIEEKLHAQLIFKSNAVHFVNRINCNLSIAVNQLIDGFNACKTCRCHGVPLEESAKTRKEKVLCPVTEQDLGMLDVNENSVIVGGRTVLFLPSFQSSMGAQQVSSPIKIEIIERTNLNSLNEGLVTGIPFVVVPISCHETEATSDDVDQTELNAQFFQELCHALHDLDQGLVCSSNCNIETMREVALRCYYLLQPSENGPMLLRRLAGSEEVLPLPDINRLLYSPEKNEIRNSIQALLSEIELRDYNPVYHERGFHQKLNLLVKESLNFGSIPPKLKEAARKASSSHSDSAEANVHPDSGKAVTEEENKTLDLKNEEKSSFIMDEWEQLIVNDVPNKYSPSCTAKAKSDHSVRSPTLCSTQMDTKTSKILERLEVPKLLKRKSVSPTTNDSGMSIRVPTKKPLIPFQVDSVADQSSPSSQLMKPNFQRLKRKGR